MDVFIFPFLGSVFFALTLDSTYGVYILNTTQVTWAVAKAACDAQGMALYEQTELGQWADLNSAVTLPVNSSFWIGLTWRSATSDWRWTDNSVMATTSFWETSQPNTATGYTCVLQNTFGGRFMTAMCTETRGYVCQASSATTVIYNTPYPRPQKKRDNNAVMLEGLLKGFACAGGLILLVALVMHLPCCKNWVKKKENEVNSWNAHLHRNKMPKEGEIEAVRNY